MACALLAACAEIPSSDTESAYKITLESPFDGRFHFDTTASVQALSFTASAQWRVKFVNSTASDWCSITPANGEAGKHVIDISVAENTAYQTRSAAFNIICGDIQKKVLVTQDGASEPDEIPDETPEETPEEQPEPDSISILAIGNSFSDDAMWYLYDLLKDAGYDSVKLGNLYIGSCTLQTHAYNITSGAKAYTYRVNQNGTWIDHESYSSADAAASEDWDFITLQQASGSSGMSETYQPYIDTIVTKVKELCPEAGIVWHMTWAYQGNSNHPEFYKYGHDQMTMYNAIVSAVDNNILRNKDFVKIIPSGTAIQNLRTSIYGDTVTRDGYHLAYDSGRLAAAMMWLKSLTGCDLDAITWTPSGQSYTQAQLAAIKESVENAYADPFRITQSALTESLAR